MKVVGITGSVGMGKTEAAKAFARRGYPVFDADAEVRRLLTEDKHAIRAVGAAFPAAVRDGGIDRQRLGTLVFRDPAALDRLETLLHPRVRRAEHAFLARAKAAGARLAVLEIPLLFETRAERLCDAVIVVSAPPAVQRERVLGRPGMTTRRFRAIQARQWPDARKRARADYVVDTGSGNPKMLRQLAKIIRMLDPPQGNPPARPHA